MNKHLLSLGAFLLLGFSTHAQWLPQNNGLATAGRAISDITVVSPQVAWAVAIDGTSGNANVREFTRTTNGGTTWTAGTITGGGLNNFSNANISAVDANTAWIALYNASAAGGRLYKTIDGGTSWVRQNPTGYATSTSFLNFVHFFDANNGITQGDPAGGRHEIFTTNNGGTTWTRVPAANMPAATSVDEWGVVNLFTVAGNTIWFGTVEGRVFKSTDLGLNWTVTQSAFTGDANNYAMDDIEFSDANNGIIKNGDQIATTTDGGATWNIVNYTGTMHFNDIAAVPGAQGTYVSVGALTLQPAALTDFGSSYSTDNGQTWTVLDNGNLYFSAEMLNTTTGWAGGFNQAGGLEGIYKWDSMVLGVSDVLNLSSKADIYPNPTTGAINIRMPAAFGNGNISIYNSVGQEVKSVRGNTSASVGFDISDLAAGTYVVRIQTVDSVITKQVVLQK